MKYFPTLPRREFLSLLGIAASTVLLKACKSPTDIAIEAVTPAATEPPIVPTAQPTQVILSYPLPEMVLVGAGKFMMGYTDGYADEQPVHPVTLTKPFYVGKYEVTFEEFDAYCDDIQRFNKPDDGGKGRGKMPVTAVDWHDAVQYCNWLSEKEGLSPCYSGGGKVTKCDFSAKGYRLPTEAEWEYAARGGQQSLDTVFAGSDDPDVVAWYAENSGGTPHMGGQKEPNELGLHDMSGNKFEWCWDWYAADYYQESPAVDPMGPPMPKVEVQWDLVRARRSGSYGESADSIRLSARSYDAPTYPGGNGFRLVRTA